MIIESQEADPVIHTTAIKIARWCRHIVRAFLREEEWIGADREFYIVARDALEAYTRCKEARGRTSKSRLHDFAGGTADHE